MNNLSAESDSDALGSTAGSAQIVAGSTPDFDAVYRAGIAGSGAIPWEDGQPNPLFVEWLDRSAHDVVRPGARIAVVGCGFGHDAKALLMRGYDVTAFDLSPAAIEHAKRLHGEWASSFCVADLFNLPSRWKRRFDLIVEIYTIQSMPPDTRRQSIAAIESLLHPHGSMFLLCRASDHPVSIDEGPPWALTVDDLRDLAASISYEPIEGIELLVDEETPPRRRLRTVLRRA
jgi:SAM-dependent methyltransferase